MGKLNVSMLRYLTREDFRSVLHLFSTKLCRFAFVIVPVRIQPFLKDIFYTVNMFLTVLRIRINQIHVFLCLLDPDPHPLVRGMDPNPAPDPDPSIIKQK
jgi:hypothetical protein